MWNIYLSFTRWRGVGPVKFVGLQNWKRLFADSTFWISFANSFWIIVAIVVIPTILGLFISSLLTDVIQKKFGGKTASFLRAMFYLPQLLPVAVAAIIMGWIFRPEDGAVNALLVKLGLGFLQTIAYILVIAALVQFIEMFLKKAMPPSMRPWVCTCPDHHQLRCAGRGAAEHPERLRLYLRASCTALPAASASCWSS